MILNCRATNGARMTIVFSRSLRQEAEHEAEVVKRPGLALTDSQRHKAMSHRLNDSAAHRERQAHYRRFYKLAPGDPPESGDVPNGRKAP